MNEDRHRAEWLVVIEWEDAYGSPQPAQITRHIADTAKMAAEGATTLLGDHVRRVRSISVAPAEHVAVFQASRIPPPAWSVV